MPRTDEAIEVEIRELAHLGVELCSMVGSSDSGMNDVQIRKISNWVARVGQILGTLFPPTSQYRVSYNTALQEKGFWNLHGNHFAHLSAIGGIIAAVEHELNKGLLENRSRLVQAEIFADFLEMAEHLLDEGYKDAAAVLISGVIEDTLRKLSESVGLPTTNNAGKALTIDPLNTQLAKEGVYEKLVQKQITSWADLRNKAAHGEYGKYTEDQVRLMLLFVQSFCADYMR